MPDRSNTRPELTLTLDKDGVIQNVVRAKSLAKEPLEQWLGRRWGEMMEPAIDDGALQKIEDVRLHGDSSCFQVRQRFPSGRELAMEYTTFSLGKKAGFVAIGRSLEAISELQSRLQLAQEARERDYWKMREIETRYRMLFDATSEAVALVSVSDLRVVEANLCATKNLDLAPGAPFLARLDDRDRRVLDEMLAKTREEGRAPGVVLRATPFGQLWSLRASLMNAESGALYLCQLAPMRDPGAADRADGFSMRSFVDRMPDGFVVVDRDGAVQAANDAFLDLVQIGSEAAAIGCKLTRWLSSPGADANLVIALVQKHGDVRRFQTTIDGELGQSISVEISAIGDDASQPNYFGLLIRDLGHRRATAEAPPRAVADASVAVDDFDNRTLEQIVKMTTETIERKAIARALERFRGNRTVAARHLGLSRQSLHAKLKKYQRE
ncbi:transcriptional regulator PpsR [Methylocystis rosea]|uniref:Transcriptional regulator PpsR n=1 Tax=Methylocystis rosea TaxID=173366 RepID=A0A3G8M8R2_9HYPH|nr:transcriptional regulator PpsR [Methylocystis rosea]AZG78311.1 transcriptional regulator PpsR [Methylocystis rosea]